MTPWKDLEWFLKYDYLFYGHVKDGDTDYYNYMYQLSGGMA